MQSASNGHSASDGHSIKVEGLSVTYRTSYERAPTFRNTLIRLGRRQRMVREIDALKDVSFSVRHGTVLGILGANGAGKSTLVRTIAGILPPTSGRVELEGRVSSASTGAPRRDRRASSSTAPTTSAANGTSW